MSDPTDLRQQPGVCCLRCSGFKLYDGKPCDVCRGTGLRPAQPESGEAVRPSWHLTASAYVLGIRHGVDPVTLVRGMLDYQLHLQSALTAAQQRITELEQRVSDLSWTDRQGGS